MTYTNQYAHDEVKECTGNENQVEGWYEQTGGLEVQDLRASKVTQMYSKQCMLCNVQNCLVSPKLVLWMWHCVHWLHKWTRPVRTEACCPLHLAEPLLSCTLVHPLGPTWPWKGRREAHMERRCDEWVRRRKGVYRKGRGDNKINSLTRIPLLMDLASFQHHEEKEGGHRTLVYL